jgi:hypothetical protein
MCCGRMFPKIITKGQCPAFFVTARFDQMNMVTVRPPPRTMEERTERVIGMRNVHVSNGPKPFVICLNWLKRGDRHLNIYDGFGAEPGNRSRSVMVDAQRQRSKRTAKTNGLRFERCRPTRIVGHYFNPVLISRQSRLPPVLPNDRIHRARRLATTSNPSIKLKNTRPVSPERHLHETKLASQKSCLATVCHVFDPATFMGQLRVSHTAVVPRLSQWSLALDHHSTG